MPISTRGRVLAEPNATWRSAIARSPAGPESYRIAHSTACQISTPVSHRLSSTDKTWSPRLLGVERSQPCTAVTLGCTSQEPDRPPNLRGRPAAVILGSAVSEERGDYAHRRTYASSPTLNCAILAVNVGQPAHADSDTPLIPLRLKTALQAT